MIRAAPALALLALAGSRVGAAAALMGLGLGGGATIAAITLATGISLLASPAQAKPKRQLPPGAGTANPSLLVATEMAFARRAREKGQWNAFAEFAQDDAVMFQPRAVLAKSWLGSQREPASPIQWQTQKIWMSCDGTLGASQGAWQNPDGTFGAYTSVWQRQKKGTFRWILNDMQTLPQALPQTDMLTASVADCGRGEPSNETSGQTSGGGDHNPDGTIIVRDTSQSLGQQGSGESRDGTLTWSYLVRGDNSRKIVVTQRKDGVMKDVVGIDTAINAGQTNGDK